MKTKFDIGQTVYFAGFDEVYEIKIGGIQIEKNVIYAKHTSSRDYSYNENDLYETEDNAKLAIVEKELQDAINREKEIKKTIAELKEEKKDLMILLLGEIK